MLKLLAKLFLFIAIAYTATLTWFSLIRMTFRVHLGDFNPTDKMLHAGAYLFLVLFWNVFLIFSKDNFARYKSNLLWVGLGSFLFGMLIEVLQGALTSYRTPDWWDIVANSTGVILAVIIFWFLAPNIERWKQKVNNLL